MFVKFDYNFKPTDVVRSFGQILGHVANSHNLDCSNVLGVMNPNQGNNIEQKTNKADSVQALKDSFTYCDKAYDGMTDAKAVQTTKLYGREVPQLGVLTNNNGHDMEHYRKPHHLHADKEHRASVQ